MSSEGKYLYVTADLSMAGDVVDETLDLSTERHKAHIQTPDLRVIGDIYSELEKDSAYKGCIFAQQRGWPGKSHLDLAMDLNKRGIRTIFLWPEEEAVEVVDDERIRSYKLLWLFCKTKEYAGRARRVLTGNSNGHGGIEQADQFSRLADNELRKTSSVMFKPMNGMPSPSNPIKGTGVYFRGDYWAPIKTGGSYGHTCYVAKELSKVSEDFVYISSNRFALLDDLGVSQLKIDPPADNGNEDNIIQASSHYYRLLKPLLMYINPSYIYERIVIGNYAMARLSRELGIPYIVEYNGSEISMKKSFGDGNGYKYEAEYLLAEEIAFSQASVINVISEPVKQDLVNRGIAPGKIFVNPNGADPGAYAPPSDEERNKLKAEFGWGPGNTVIGFIGTFGGWHGVDTLAEIAPKTLALRPDARFILIGDGNFRHVVEGAVKKNGIGGKVVLTGSVPQKEGARLLRACDIYLSPHNSHMVDSKFFGSPTKLFEYMALGGGIVASNLEQIGEVLSPALYATALTNGEKKPDGEIAILCRPGKVEDFLEGIIYLMDNPAIRKKLGENARRALVERFSWENHVNRLWDYALNLPAPEVKRKTDAGLNQINSGDAYKDEVQNQWNNDPCGSHYVKAAKKHTLDWFLEAERYRYTEYAPWMPKTMEFAEHSGEKVLEIGAGMGTDLAQFGKNGAIVTDVDLSAGHLAHARENFKLRGLSGEFIHQDAETLPFGDNTFDVVYSNGVIHHTPNTAKLISEIRRVLKPGGKAIIMVYAEYSLHYWRELVLKLGLQNRYLEKYSIGEIMSRHVEITETGAKPLVKVYSARRLRRMFAGFENITVVKRQLITAETPGILKFIPIGALGKIMGWNLVLKAFKPKGRP